MANPFFDHPILNSPYECPRRHWELNDQGQPTQRIVDIRKDMPKKGRGQGDELDPLKLPTRLQTALQALYGHYEKTFNLWLDAGIRVPPCFIIVCQNTAIGTHPAQLMYQELADMACNRITAGITRALEGKRPIKALLDPYNPTGSTAHVRFNTSRAERWETSSKSCHINWVVFDSDWEAEFCRVAESHPKVRAYVKNHNLGLEVPYRYGSEIRKYRPDLIVLVDDGRRPDDLLHLVVEIKGYRREDAKEKKSTMETYWVPGANNLKQYGRWAFAEFREVYQIESDFAAKVETEFNKMIAQAIQS